ncbi:MAG: hypothetical protein ACT4TC_03375 [Myxococcaceae bacterium]
MAADAREAWRHVEGEMHHLTGCLLDNPRGLVTVELRDQLLIASAAQAHRLRNHELLTPVKPLTEPVPMIASKFY